MSLPSTFISKGQLVDGKELVQKNHHVSQQELGDKTSIPYKQMQAIIADTCY